MCLWRVYGVSMVCHPPLPRLTLPPPSVTPRLAPPPHPPQVEVQERASAPRMSAPSGPVAPAGAAAGAAGNTRKPPLLLLDLTTNKEGTK